MNNGLEDVVAAETVLSDVDGLAGRLVIRGLPLDALAGRMSYEQVLGLLWDGFFPDLPGDLAQPARRRRGPRSSAGRGSNYRCRRPAGLRRRCGR